MKKPKPPEYIPTGRTAEGRAECKRLMELALLRGWVQADQRARVSMRPPTGKGSQWGWGK